MELDTEIEAELQSCSCWICAESDGSRYIMVIGPNGATRVGLSYRNVPNGIVAVISDDRGELSNIQQQTIILYFLRYFSSVRFVYFSHDHLLFDREELRGGVEYATE